jgi:uncharacterized protein with HEPN domain
VALTALLVEGATQAPVIEWREAAGFRDVLIHEYFGIDTEALWDTIKTNIPSFKKKITAILQQER